LQYVHVPNYSALILRQSIRDLSLPDALLDRAHRWLRETDAVWSAFDKKYTFPQSGATLQFGYCDAESDLAHYKGPGFQYVGIDELTEWPESWSRFMFSRIRRKVGQNVPLKFRAATNPDGPGADWVRDRYGIPLDSIPDAPIWSNDGKRVFWPARAEDNPTLDLESYDLSLQELGPAKYEQLRWGKWRQDVEGLVYEFDETRNVVDELPTLHRVTLGIDYGARNACAWTVWGWNDFDPTMYGVLSTKQENMTPSECAEFTNELELKFMAQGLRFSRITGDVGGLGRGYADETQARFRIPIEPAQKVNKAGYIRLYNGDLRRARVKLLRSTCGPLIDEYKKLRKRKNSEEEAPGLPNHCADSALYSWRDAYAYLPKEPKKELTPAEHVAEADKARLSRELRARKHGGDRWQRMA
jgi:hypothetical protein